MRISAALLSFIPISLWAAPFDQCPTEAFLFQDPTTVVYGVDLVTGKADLLAGSTGISGTVNAVGFDESERYIYGFSKDLKDVVQIDSDFQATAQGVTGLPQGVHFFVGDVADSTYWVYKKNTGLFAIPLVGPDAMQASEIVGADLSLNLTDFAFHPGDGNLYALDNSSGLLHRIDTSDGSATVVADAGITGTFGAGYFEKSGFFYVSRNQDGQIFRLDLRDPANIANGATLFAYGPSSGQNDGARCASAPIVASNTDFGDAPDSYGTTLASNGARHALLSGGPVLGASVDADNDGLQAPFSDDSTQSDDEDGVVVMTGLQSGQDALLIVTVSGTGGYLQGFFDWDRNGQFETDDEWAIADRYLDPGEHRLLVRVPDGVSEGSSYARFRLSSAAGIGPMGGAADGEVEDQAIELSVIPLTYTYYPSANTWATLAFEDHWPRQADFDMNDLVVAIRTTEVRSSGEIVRIDVQGTLVANGADYHNGFAFHLPGVSAGAVDVTRLKMRINGVDRLASGQLEPGRTDAIVRIFDDAQSVISKSCRYYRTDKGCDDGLQYQFELTIPFVSGTSGSGFPAMPYNPFLFATPGTYRQGFDQPPGRGLEIHLADHPPTEAADVGLFGTEADRTVPGASTYRNDNNLPWAMLLTQSWHWPASGVDLLHAYPQFEQYILSDGSAQQDWYLRSKANTDQLFE
ncbi:LruC domain-containing protein [Ferrimonas pelagia]|uniref:LruC domain-containing protein n=1 Tax=Ferrimonas pelagia TaxID=1177826 RepID=A0ABP9ES55_9GAMM